VIDSMSQKMESYSPEKAGVGGSIPSLATIIRKQLHDSAAFLQPTIRCTCSDRRRAVRQQQF
jgi:hypothetical protein